MPWLTPGKPEEPPERVAADGQQVVAHGEQDPVRRRVPAQPALREECVHEEAGRVGTREDVRGRDRGQPPHLPRDDEEGEKEQDFLPGRDDVERPPANTGVPELRHDDVVEREPDDERDERGDSEAGAASRQSLPGSARG